MNSKTHYYVTVEKTKPCGNDMTKNETGKARIT